MSITCVVSKLEGGINMTPPVLTGSDKGPVLIGSSCPIHLWPSEILSQSSRSNSKAIDNDVRSIWLLFNNSNHCSNEINLN